MRNKYKWFWVIGILTYGVADLVTTFYGITVLGAIESNYLPKQLIDTYGIWIFLPVKVIVIGGLYAINTHMPHPYNLPCPILFCIFGIYAVVNNVVVIYQLI